MKRLSVVVAVMFLFFAVSCSSGGNSTKDDEVVSDENQTGDSDTAGDIDTATDGETQEDSDTVNDMENESDTDEDAVTDETPDSDSVIQCEAPSEMTEYDKKPYAKMRIYQNPAEMEEYSDEDIVDDPEVSDTDEIEGYPDEDPAGVEMSFKTEFGTVSWEGGSYDINAMIMPDFESEDETAYMLFVQGFEHQTGDSDYGRWFIFMMDAQTLKDMKSDGVNKIAISPDNAALFLINDFEEDSIKKSCTEAVLKTGEVYACHDPASNYGMYELMDLWFTFDLETDEAKILEETQREALCDCNNLNGDPVDCETGLPIETSDDDAI